MQNFIFFLMITFTYFLNKLLNFMICINVYDVRISSQQLRDLSQRVGLFVIKLRNK